MVWNLTAIINRYDWRRRSTDILRSLYGHFIPGKHRRSFGEYYTPDWLAEHICYKIISERYIKTQLNRFRNGEAVSGVLDPFCGSGTFLVHAIGRISNSKALSEARLSERQRVDFISSMIYGMDIHPVAVEMARANVRRLLPSADQINVYQGDSLLISRSDSSVLSVGGENMFLESPGGRKLIIPKSFLKTNDNIRAFVESAKDGAKFPPGLDTGLNMDESDTVKQAHYIMTDIIKEEQNGIWYWYIVNQAAPILLKEKKVGRIVSNPPWVALQEIQVATRKAEITSMAKSMGLYVGRVVAGKLDVAMLAMARSTGLYLDGNRTGWVLPQGAMTGAGNWEKLTKLYEGRMTEMWDLGRLV
ncbi:MAG: N-6 DNA methylase [Cenarchaeum sp. SB0665_bin_23]|nr:N-6 DNA methylase [Cenarchaeum sp. SB0665_bin_23]MYB46834.1 N-6 DNA methylase [Cenarchaeum sp. SB0662_bin_33]MYC80356.1 N-6 DNA methylase [Cenarchaeum sp. SB0661_bin_35]MYG32944.1 N-6 DNA methylase [Cenarchaeum sp. SB0677_bin_16]